MKKSKIILKLLTPAAAFLTASPFIALTSCGGSSQSATITSVKVTAPQTTVKINTGVQLSVEVQGTGSFSKEVSWSVNDTSKATISDAGLLTGLSSGQVIATAISKADKTKSGSVTLMVTDKTPIVTNVTNGTISGDTEIGSSETKELTLTPNGGYKLPDTVDVLGATSIYDKTTGKITISDPIGDKVTITATCVEITITPVVENNNAENWIIGTINYGTYFGDIGQHVTSCTCSSVKSGQPLVINYTTAENKYLVYGPFSTIAIGDITYQLDSEGITHDVDNHTITVAASLLTSESVVIHLNAGNLAAVPYLSFLINLLPIELGPSDGTTLELNETKQIVCKCVAETPYNDRKFKIRATSSTVEASDYIEVNSEKLTFTGKQLCSSNEQQIKIEVCSSSKNFETDYKLSSYINVISKITEYTKVTAVYDAPSFYINSTTEKGKAYEITCDFNDSTAEESVLKSGKWFIVPSLAQCLKIYINGTLLEYNKDYQFGNPGAYFFIDNSWVQTFTKNTIVTIKFYSATTLVREYALAHQIS